MGGEIDIVEGVNNQAHNQMTLHSGTSNACTIDTADEGAFTGQTLGTNCYSTQSADAGCGISDTSSTSFGYGFNNAGGGVYALLWEPSSMMAIWHFARANIPADITSQTPTPKNWGSPTGLWPATTCDIGPNFYQHSMIFDTTICGGWAGGAYGSSGCPGTCSEMVSNATNFASELIHPLWLSSLLTSHLEMPNGGSTTSLSIDEQSCHRVDVTRPMHSFN